jgi:UbiD family decarboxylase
MNRDLRQWITEVEKIGEIKHLKGAHWDLEIGTIYSIANSLGQTSAILFDEIPDYPRGYRVIVNELGAPGRLAMTLELGTSVRTTGELIRLWRDRLRNIVPVPHVVVKDGPIFENVQEGAEVNLLRFPVPRWHELDGGRYIGTACMVITRDPDEGWVNVGNYRKGCWSGPLDPIIPPGQKGLNSRAVIDACKPFLWIDKFPATVEPSKELRDKVLRKWGSSIT